MPSLLKVFLSLPLKTYINFDSENPRPRGSSSNVVGTICTPLVGIGFTDLTKYGIPLNPPRLCSPWNYS